MRSRPVPIRGMRRSGTCCYHIGPARDLSLMEGNGLTRTTDPQAGEFVLVSGPFDDSDDLGGSRSHAAGVPRAQPQAGLRQSRPRGDPRRDAAGLRRRDRRALSNSWAATSGQHGKPYRSIYDEALALLAVSPRRACSRSATGFATDIARRRGVLASTLRSSPAASMCGDGSDGQPATEELERASPARADAGPLPHAVRPTG
jgi:hypothetical protein